MWLKEIKLQAASPALLRDFYKNIIELPVIDTGPDIIIQAGASRLLFSSSGNDQHPFYHFAFNIPFNKVEEARKWLKQKVQLLWLQDYDSEIAEFVNWQARSVYFIDPDGNIVELIGRKEPQDETKLPFSSGQIRCISEIGVVFPEDQFDPRVKMMMTDHRLSYFEKQKPMEYFRAIGDDYGLLICVPEGRSWYPCHNKSAGLFPIKILAETKGRHIGIDIP